MPFKKTHKMVLTEMTELCQLLYGNPLLIMILDKLQHQLQLLCNLSVFLAAPLIRYLAVQQEKQMEKLRLNLQFIAKGLLKKGLPDFLKGFPKEPSHGIFCRKIYRKTKHSTDHRGKKFCSTRVCSLTLQHIQAKNKAVCNRFCLRLFASSMKHSWRKDQNMPLTDFIGMKINLIDAVAFLHQSNLKFLMPVYRQVTDSKRKNTVIVFQGEHGRTMLHRLKQ